MPKLRSEELPLYHHYSGLLCRGPLLSWCGHINNRRLHGVWTHIRGEEIYLTAELL